MHMQYSNRQKDILVIFKTIFHNMVISTDYEIVCIAKIGCLSLKHLGTALVNTAGLFWRFLISNQNAFYNSISQRNTGAWAMNEKQKLFPKVWRTLKYKTEYTHTWY